MIKISEVYKELEYSLKGFKKGVNPKKSLENLNLRLNQEVTGSCTDIDLTLIELKNGLKEHLQKSFKDDIDSLSSLKKIVKKFIKDLRETEILRFVEFAQKLERLL